MSEWRVRAILVATWFLGLALSASFPHGTMIIGGLSWDYLGGMFVGLSIGAALVRRRDAADRMGRAIG